MQISRHNFIPWYTNKFSNFHIHIFINTQTQCTRIHTKKKMAAMRFGSNTKILQKQKPLQNLRLNEKCWNIFNIFGWLYVHKFYTCLRQIILCNPKLLIQKCFSLCVMRSYTIIKQKQMENKHRNTDNKAKLISNINN